MNKSQTTQKYIKGIYNNIIVVGYCDLYYLLWAKNADYYNAGVYGWNADIYLWVGHLYLHRLPSFWKHPTRPQDSRKIRKSSRKDC